MIETPAQFTERLREKYKDVLEQIEENGYTADQQLIDDFIAKLLNEPPKEKPKYKKLSEILRNY